MLVLFVCLFVLANGIVWIVFNQRISRNLPKIEKPTRRDITPDGLWNPLRVGQLATVVGLAGVIVSLIRLR